MPAPKSAAKSAAKPKKSAAPQRPVSAARLAANRANAQRSRGPRTAAGKARSCLNRYGRGFFVERLLIDTLARREDPDEFATLHMRWHQTLRPCTEVESDCVEKCCAAQQQVQRLTELDGMLLEWYQRERGMEGVAEWFKRAASRQARITAHERETQRWLRELAKEQAGRLGRTPQWTSALPSPETQFLATEPPGFVGTHADADCQTAASPVPASPSPALPLPEEREGEPPARAAGREEIPPERLAAMTDTEFHAAASQDVPLPAGYRYTQRGIVFEEPKPPELPRQQADPFPREGGRGELPLQESNGAPPLATASPATPPADSTSPAATTPPAVPPAHKFRFPTPYPGQAPLSALGALDPVARYPHLAAAVSSGAHTGNGSAPQAPVDVSASSGRFG
jgi:hypothetical protein